MSDRTSLIKLETGVDNSDIELFIDHETGTYRLFLDGQYSVDFSEATLKEFYHLLGNIFGADANREV